MSCTPAEPSLLGKLRAPFLGAHSFLLLAPHASALRADAATTTCLQPRLPETGSHFPPGRPGWSVSLWQQPRSGRAPSPACHETGAQRDRGERKTESLRKPEVFRGAGREWGLGLAPHIAPRITCEATAQGRPQATSVAFAKSPHQHCSKYQHTHSPASVAYGLQTTGRQLSGWVNDPPPPFGWTIPSRSSSAALRLLAQ